jgi:hypothetical protein
VDSRFPGRDQQGRHTVVIVKTMVLALVLFPALAGSLGGEAAIVLAFG